VSRLENTGKNLAYSVAATILTSLMSFITRTVFIRTIGIEYLGANSLFTNVLALLSLTELGFGSAIAFSLYRPLAYKDVETIKSLMLFYKKAYRIIAFVILGLGILITPFLQYIVHDPGNIEHIYVIYFVFLYNTVVSYLFSHRMTILAADQKSYLMTNVNLVITILTSGIQLVVMLTTKNYFVYLFVGVVINTVQWYFINRFIDRYYPYLQDEHVLPLASKEKKQIAKNVKAMVFHKFGELCINQTDNIIISSFISITAVGLYNNYYMIIGIINKFAVSVFSAATASLGNLIATESYERRYEVFKRYNFLGFWVYTWTGICLFQLLHPFVELWLGSEYLIGELTLALVILNYYLVGMRTPIGNVKMAAGLYAQDRWAPIIQAAINLIVSIAAVRKMGLAGVFLGTVVSSICVPCWYRPVIVYRHVFHRPVREYFAEYLRYAVVAGLALAAVAIVNSKMIESMIHQEILSFLFKMAACALVPNAVVILFYHKTDEYRYIMGLIRKLSIRAFGR